MNIYIYIYSEALRALPPAPKVCFTGVLGSLVRPFGGVWAVLVGALGASWWVLGGVLGGIWAVLGSFLNILGYLGSLLTRFGALLGSSRALLGLFGGPLGATLRPSWSHIVCMLGPFEAHWGVYAWRWRRSKNIDFPYVFDHFWLATVLVESQVGLGWAPG